MKINYTTSKFFLFGSLTVASITLALIYFYLSSPNVVTSEWGGPEQFGQFGDMIGGTLNPVFGFLTVILLIRTFKLEHSRSTLEIKLKTKEELLKLLEHAKSDNKRLIEEKIFENNEGTNHESLANLRLHKEQYSQAIIQVENAFSILKKNKNPNLFDLVENTTTNIINSRYLGITKNIYHQTTDIIEIYMALLDKDYPKLSNKYYISELDSYLFNIWFQLKIFTKGEHLVYILNACENAGIDHNELNLSFPTLTFNKTK